MLLDQFSFSPQTAPVLIMYDCFSVWDQLQSAMGRCLTDTKCSFFIRGTQRLEHAWQIPGECVAIIMRYCVEAKAEKQMLLPLFPMLSKWYLYNTSLTFMALAHMICEELGIPWEHSRLFDVFDILKSMKLNFPLCLSMRAYHRLPFSYYWVTKVSRLSNKILYQSSDSLELHSSTTIVLMRCIMKIVKV
jgi:hypothetical protein